MASCLKLFPSTLCERPPVDKHKTPFVFVFFYIEMLMNEKCNLHTLHF